MTDKQNKSPPTHTPSHWHFDSGFIVAPDPSGKHPDIYIAEIVAADDEGRIAPDEQRDPNGYLLAVAPELLETLEFVHGWFVDNELDSEYYAIFEEICAAIAKVRGQQ